MTEVFELKRYHIEKDSNQQIVIRMTPAMAKDVADAIDHGWDKKAEHANFVNALADAIHDLAGD